MLARCRWLFVLAAMSVGSPALATSIAPPMTYKHVVPGGKYVFVMISPFYSVEDDAGHWEEKAAAGIREIRRVYTKSGLYLNDGSTQPLWTVDWYGYADVASDGIHMIRLNPFASTPGHEAVSFYASGILLKTYLIRDLVDTQSIWELIGPKYSWKKERASSTIPY